MGKRYIYGEIAVRAAGRLQSGSEDVPRRAWEEAAEFFGSDRGCAMAAFLGLCEAGEVEGVEKGRYTRSELNKRYTLKALQLLRSDFKGSPMDLWRQVANISHNGQMHVLVALYGKNFLKP